MNDRVGFDNFRFSSPDFPEPIKPLPEGRHYVWHPILSRDVIYFMNRKAWLRGKADRPANFYIIDVSANGDQTIEENE